MKAGAPHLCPKACVGISRSPAVSLVVSDATPTGHRLGGIDTDCRFALSKISHKVALLADQSEEENANESDNAQLLGHTDSADRSRVRAMMDGARRRKKPQDVAVVAGYRVPVVRDASHLRAAIRVGLDMEIWKGSGVKVWLGTVHEKHTLKLFQDLDSKAGVCGVVGVVGELLANGKVLKRQSTAHKVIHGGLIELDISEAVQKLVSRRDWCFNTMLLAMMEFLDQWGRPMDMRKHGRALVPGELLLKFARPSVKKADDKYAEYSSYYGDSYGSGSYPGYNDKYASYSNYYSGGNSYGSSGYGSNDYGSYKWVDNLFDLSGILGANAGYQYGNNNGKTGYIAGKTGYGSTYGNTGYGNTGYGNTGHGNTGYWTGQDSYGASDKYGY
ncbi:MAG: hypothetical protein MHM6MM_009330 [Cercozoa sp. M6MM]